MNDVVNYEGREAHEGFRRVRLRTGRRLSYL